MQRPVNLSIVFIGVVFLLCSCSRTFFQGEDLFHSGRYRLATDEVSGCTLEAVSFERSGQLVVKGEMTFHHHPDAPFSGDVLGELISPQGDPLGSKSVPFTAYPHGRHNHPAAEFELTFDRVPEAGSLIRLSHTLRHFDGGPDESVIR